MDILVCDTCQNLIKSNEDYYSLEIRGERYSLNDENRKEFDVDMSKYLYLDICASCYSELEKLMTKIRLVNHRDTTS